MKGLYTPQKSQENKNGTAFYFLSPRLANQGQARTKRGRHEDFEEERF